MCFRVIVEVQDGSHAEVGPLQCGASRLRHVALDDFCDACCREVDVFGVLSLSVDVLIHTYIQVEVRVEIKRL